MNTKTILEELNKRGHELTMSIASDNKSVTAITSGSKTFIEHGFSGCGAVSFTMDKKDWREASKLGFKKGYRDWSYGGNYYNGQFGDACRGYNQALSEFQEKHSGSFLEKISVDSWID